MQRPWRQALSTVLMSLLAGCTGYSPKSNFTMPTFPGLSALTATGQRADGKATVMFSANFEGVTCAEKRIVLAQSDGAGGFKTVRVERIDNQFGGGAGAAVIDLDPGTYHIVQYACRNGLNVVHAGTNTGAAAVPWEAARWDRSLASFAVAGGDVVDAGEIVLTPQKIDGFAAGGLNGRKAVLVVHELSGQAMAEIVRDRPDIAHDLRSVPMQMTGSAQQTIAKCRLVPLAKPLPRDGSSKLPDMLAEHPEAAPVVEAIGTPTTGAQSCVADTKAAPFGLGQ